MSKMSLYAAGFCLVASAGTAMSGIVYPEDSIYPANEDTGMADRDSSDYSGSYSGDFTGTENSEASRDSGHSFPEQSGLPFDFHRNNLPVKPDDFLLSRSCEELDQAISYMLPATYSYRPGFYDNPYASAAIWGSASPKPGFMEHLWYYLPYSWLVGYLEDGRRHEVYYKVEQLRRTKAMKNCFVK